MENVREASQRAAGEIMDYILDRISSGDWPNGHRIPTEKSLISQFSAARNTVRKALGKLEQEGIIVRYVGRGTFVRGEDEEPESDIAAFIKGDASPSEINELRVILEPATAEIVVARATETEIRHAQKCLQNTLAAKSVEEYERWEAELHLTIINSARNTVLTRIYKAIHLARNKTAWKEIKRRSLNDMRRERYERDHAAMVDAFARRDAVGLRQAMKSHLESVSHNMVNPVS
ncbi:FCD domain-containing protein [Haliea sp. E1-2-M8]|uniref:FadR/GntR family transcriptional regulator n=1 Tax=Haliea sp. E1-2-M8 TaxID=3064706 RepID=UPI00271A0B89|nr:FCD domain-containing protein [Haliea sp. E1-2-M8]MDO8863775.1 FCD domain-containing protein [Haliea sp. E1-2-M8]